MAQAVRETEKTKSQELVAVLDVENREPTRSGKSRVVIGS